MTFSHRIVNVLVSCGLTAMAIGCVEGPGPIDFRAVPTTDSTYRWYSLQQMVALPDSTYLAINYSVYRIDPRDRGASDGIVRMIGYVTNFYSNNRSILFLDSADRVCLVDDHYVHVFASIDSPVTTTYFELPPASAPWYGLHCVDARSNCWVVGSVGSVVGVYRWIDGSAELQFRDTLSLPQGSEAHFAANDSCAIITYSQSDSLTTYRSVTRARIYRNGRYVWDDTLLNREGIGVRALLLLDNKAWAVIVDSSWGQGETLLRWTEDESRWVSAGWSNLGASFTGDLDITYRDTGEVWVHNDHGYLAVSPDKVTRTYFRQSWINAFNVLCFRKDGTGVLFDEATQEFLFVPPGSR